MRLTWDHCRRRRALVALMFITSLASVGTAQAQSPAEWVVPERRARRPNPVPNDAVAIAQGRTAFAKECQSCHGVTGRGDGTNAGSLNTRPSDLTSTRVQAQSDGALFFKITEGRGDMPNARTTLTDEQRWMLVHYVRTLATKP